MSIVRLRSDPKAQDFFWLPPDQTCFYCGEVLTGPSVMWMGVGQEIYLHPGCVVELFLRLGRDVHELECKENFAFDVASTSVVLPDGQLRRMARKRARN